MVNDRAASLFDTPRVVQPSLDSTAFELFRRERIGSYGADYDKSARARPLAPFSPGRGAGGKGRMPNDSGGMTERDSCLGRPAPELRPGERTRCARQGTGVNVRGLTAAGSPDDGQRSLACSLHATAGFTGITFPSSEVSHTIIIRSSRMIVQFSPSSRSSIPCFCRASA